MTTFRKTLVKSEIAGDEPLSDYALGYFNERVRNSFYDYVLRRFHEAAEQDGLTKAKLARRLGLAPARVTRLLGSPGNWTLDTVSELLVGICREELRPQSKPYLQRPVRNYQFGDLLLSRTTTQNARGMKHDDELKERRIQANSALREMGSRASQANGARLPNIAGLTP